MSVLLVVPSRLGSTRFPKKVLALLDGKPIVRWCWEAATAAGVGDVLIATEAEEVADAVAGFGGKAVLTSASCQSGTDRCLEAAKGRRDELIINVQGDQPFIKPETIRSVVKLLQEDRAVDIATAVMPLTDQERIKNPNVVKAVMNDKGRCLYFSRSPIPFPRNPATARYWEHIGIYGFRRAALERFVSLPPSPLELSESLEQLRALEAGMQISSTIVDEIPVAVDVAEDLVRAETFLRRTI
jgi:3-deoxy-manno-octulosonate cytidylyltransferase (CMP-KDO synthetase)